LSDKAGPNIKIKRGAVVRVALTPKGTWDVTQLPEVEGAFVAINPQDGSVKALVGGFDFAKT
jgi:penicillin-binding protein 1A